MKVMGVYVRIGRDWVWRSIVLPGECRITSAGPVTVAWRLDLEDAVVEALWIDPVGRCLTLLLAGLTIMELGIAIAAQLGRSFGVPI